MRLRQARDRAAVQLGLIALFFVAPGPALPQDSPSLEIGSRVRVKEHRTRTNWVVGELEELQADSVRLRTSKHPQSVALALSSDARFEVSSGWRSGVGRGALIGTAIGTALGLVLGLVTYEECSGFCPAPDPGQAGAVAITGGLGGLVGAGIGALIGRSAHVETWEPVPRPWAAGAEQPSDRPTVALGVPF